MAVDNLRKSSSINKAGRTSGGLAPKGKRAESARRDRGGRLLNLQAAETYTGLPSTTLRELTQNGELSVVKFGRRWYFKRSDLDALIERNTERHGDGL